MSAFHSFIPELTHLLHTWCGLFIGGQASQYLSEWEKLTKDKTLLTDIKGITIECNEPPIQHVLFKPKLSLTEAKRLEKELVILKDKAVIGMTTPKQGQIISGVFLHPKKDGSYRLILNLKQFNAVVEYHHFKMDSLYGIINLMEENCFMASIDIKDAYYSFAINFVDRKYLCFQWKGQLYHYTCLPNGLSLAPRKFTKIMKVPLSHLHLSGHISLGHLDDFYLQGRTYEQCVKT